MNTLPPYFLKSERLGFRRWSEADMELAWELWGDPEVTGLIGGPFSREQVRARLLAEIAGDGERGVQYWPLFLLGTGAFAGCCGLRPRPEKGVYEAGVHLRKIFRGKGYAAEALRAVIGYAFGTLGAAWLFAGHHPANDASRRLLRQLGFSYTHDEYYPPTGLRHPSYKLIK